VRVIAGEFEGGGEGWAGGGARSNAYSTVSTCASNATHFGVRPSTLRERLDRGALVMKGKVVGDGEGGGNEGRARRIRARRRRGAAIEAASAATVFVMKGSRFDKAGFAGYGPFVH